MKKQLIQSLPLCLILFTIISCQKTISDFDNTGGANNNTDHTVVNISGTYGLKALTWTYLGTTINVYDSLEAREKDDLYTFNSNLTFTAKDAGIVCAPPGDVSTTWALRNDSIFLNGSTNGAKIKSFDGTTLIMTGTPLSDPGVYAVTTYVRK